MTIRTRLAPSPTGFIHIGTLRTALWDYFLARQQGGTFVIRVEDTDQERSVEGALEGLLRTLATVGITHDEGPFLSEDGSLHEVGEYGPYIQSARLPLYRKYVDELLHKGFAYVCFCSSEELETMRAQQMAAKQNPKYDRRCLKVGGEEVARRVAAGESHVVRMKVPEGTSEFVDAIRGHIEFNNADVDDQILMKSDGRFPTYHLAVVVDDHLMGITHVLRGEEWISSTPKQIILYKMFGWDMPVHAHVPLLLNPDKTKLSKRKGDVSVESYLAKGYVPEALLNFIATLGFNPTSDREIFTMDELVAAFDLAKVNKSGAVVNMEKLDWMNHQYLMKMSEDDLLAAARPFLHVEGDTAVIRRAIMVERMRVNRLDEFAAHIAPYVAQPEYPADLLVWKKADAPDAKKSLEGVRSVVSGLADDSLASPELIDTAIREYIMTNGLQNGNVLWPLRVALSGQEKSASPFELVWALGKDLSLERINIALDKLT
ncbi:MAG: glutamate--tRNA ligase [Candidatus Uhrbacteria bacterium]|nr:glutamate--tRNA ligase [Candidatus Uhrbacteria bacterium]